MGVLLRISVVIIYFVCAAPYLDGAEGVIPGLAFRLAGAMLDFHSAQTLLFRSRAVVRVLLRLGTSPTVLNLPGALTYMC